MLNAADHAVQFGVPHLRVDGSRQVYLLLAITIEQDLINSVRCYSRSQGKEHENNQTRQDAHGTPAVMPRVSGCWPTPAAALILDRSFLTLAQPNEDRWRPAKL